MRLRHLFALSALILCTACGHSEPLQSTAPGPGANPSPTPAADAARPLGSYLHDLSQPDPALTVESAVVEHYAIETSNGIVIDSWIRRPNNGEAQPLVLVVTPYYGGGDPTSPLNRIGDPSLIHAQHLLPRGYAVGVMSLPGTGNSSSCYRSGGVDERQSLGDAIEHLAMQPWSNGRVGTIGVSFDGATSVELFAEAPPSLKTVVPIAAVTDYYRYGFNNGILRFVNGSYPIYYVGVTGVNPAGIEGGIGAVDPEGFVGAVAGEACPEAPEFHLDAIENVATSDKGEFWQERDNIAVINSSLDKPRASMFYVQGFQDANVDGLMSLGLIEAVEASGVPFHQWWGQWVHAYPQPTEEGVTCGELEPCRGDFFEEFLVAWFDQFLKDRDTGVLDAPPVQLQADDGVWRHADRWPPSGLQTLDFYPSADGGLAPAATNDTVSYKDHKVTVTSQAGIPQNTLPAPISGTELEFVSAPLRSPLRLTGVPVFETEAMADGSRGNLVLTLFARKPDGTQRYINFAAMHLNHSQSLETGMADITDVALPFSVQLFPQDNLIGAGEQLVLIVAGQISSQPRTASGNTSNLLNFGARLMPIGGGANIQLDLAKTRLRLFRNPSDIAEELSWLAPAAP